VGFFPSSAGSGLGWFYEPRENLFAGPPAIYICLRVKFSKRAKTRADVRVLGQFDINDSIKKCHIPATCTDVQL
jgi:hypothetical protein